MSDDREQLKQFVLLGADGSLAVCVKLYGHNDPIPVDKLAVVLVDSKPHFYGILTSEDAPYVLLNTEIVDENCEILGEL